MTFWEFLSAPLVLSVATAIAGSGATWFGLRVKLNRTEADLQDARSELQLKRGRIEELEKAVLVPGGENELPTVQRLKAVSKLNDIIDHSQADSATLYVPVHNDRKEFLGLLVLATAPTDKSGDSFLGTVFAGRDSRAVQAYLTGKPIHDRSSGFRIDDYEVAGVYADCLQTSATKGDGKKVGVAQLLSETGPIDAELAATALERFYDDLVDIAKHFNDDRENMIELSGLEVPRRASRGTVLSVDISNSSGLFVDEARFAVTQALMGELVEKGSQRILAERGTFESFTGDGFIAAFSGGARDEKRNPAARCYRCAIALVEDMDALLERYSSDLKHLKVDLNIRIGMSTGIIHPFSISLGQLRAGSILGRTASLAKKMCDLGPRNRPSLIVDDATFFELGEELQSHFEAVDETRERSYAGVAHSLRQAVFGLRT